MAKEKMNLTNLEDVSGGASQFDNLPVRISPAEAEMKAGGTVYTTEGATDAVVLEDSKPIDGFYLWRDKVWLLTKNDDKNNLLQDDTYPISKISPLVRS